jgi:hypothetical protein
MAYDDKGFARISPGTNSANNVMLNSYASSDTVVTIKAPNYFNSNTQLGPQDLIITAASDGTTILMVTSVTSDNVITVATLTLL